MAAEIYMHDAGTAFRATIVDEAGAVVDVSTATVKKIWFRKPDGSTAEFDAEFVSDGADGRVEYVTAPADLDQAGNWKVQGYVQYAGGRIHSDIHAFKVLANLRPDPS